MRIDWNNDAFKAIRYGRHDSSLIGLLEAEGQKIVDRANASSGGGYALGSRPGVARPQGRHRVTVITASYKAIRDNAKNNTLLRALGGG